MCGRFTRDYTWRQVHDFLDLRFPSLAEMAPSWNVAPTQASPVCRLSSGAGRELAPLVWGFVPSWSKDPARSSINARCETVATSPAFRAAFKSRRCLVPASGFYEWMKPAEGGGRKRPHFIRLKEEPILCFAGIWETHHVEGAAVEAFAILTTRPNSLLASIHDRMPVILPRERFSEWLDPANPAPGPALFEPFPEGRMEMFPVSTRVNSPRANDAGLCHPEPGGREASGSPGLFG